MSNWQTHFSRLGFWLLAKDAPNEVRNPVFFFVASPWWNRFILLFRTKKWRIEYTLNNIILYYIILYIQFIFTTKWLLKVCRNSENFVKAFLGSFLNWFNFCSADPPSFPLILVLVFDEVCSSFIILDEYFIKSNLLLCDYAN